MFIGCTSVEVQVAKSEPLLRYSAGRKCTSVEARGENLKAMKNPAPLGAGRATYLMHSFIAVVKIIGKTFFCVLSSEFVLPFGGSCVFWRMLVSTRKSDNLNFIPVANPGKQIFFNGNFGVCRRYIGFNGAETQKGMYAKSKIQNCGMPFHANLVIVLCENMHERGHRSIKFPNFTNKQTIFPSFYSELILQ